MINSLNYSLFPKDEFFTFSKEAINIVDINSEGIISIGTFIDKAKLALVQFQAALERERKNPFTVELSEADSIRDAVFMSFRKTVEAASLRNNPQWNSAGKAILETIRKYGWRLPAKGYKAESAAIVNLTSELRAKLMTELTLINALDLLAELETAQNTFDAIYHESVTKFPVGEPTIWETRPPLTDALRSLFAMISLQQSAAPSEALNTIETGLNALITRSLATVKAADTRGENAAKEETNKPTEQPS